MRGLSLSVCTSQQTVYISFNICRSLLFERLKFKCKMHVFFNVAVCGYLAWFSHHVGRSLFSIWEHHSLPLPRKNVCSIRTTREMSRQRKRASCRSLPVSLESFSCRGVFMARALQTSDSLLASLHILPFLHFLYFFCGGARRIQF